MNLKKLIIENKVIALIIAISIVIVSVAVAVISGRSSGDKHNKTLALEESADSTQRKTSSQTKEDETQTVLVEETVTTEETVELETSEDGSLSITTEDGQKIDLSADGIETETSNDGSTTYKMSDGSQVVINSDGSAKVVKTETVTKFLAQQESIAAATTTTSSGETSTSTSSQTTTTKPAQSTQVPTQQQTTQPVTTQQTTTAKPTQTNTQQTTTAKPTQATTQPTTTQQQTTQQQTTIFTPVCYHDVEYLYKKVTTPATSTTYGEWTQYCSNCNQITNTGSIHPYSAYQVDLGNGNSATVYGWYDDDMANEIYQQLNAYRVENGLNALENEFSEFSKIRAVECAYSFSHVRPNNEDFLLAENIAGGFGTDNDSATEFINRWKNSPGHDSNMLDTLPTTCGIGVFFKIDFDEDGVPCNGGSYAVQNFGW